MTHFQYANKIARKPVVPDRTSGGRGLRGRTPAIIGIPVAVPAGGDSTEGRRDLLTLPTFDTYYDHSLQNTNI